MNKIVNVEMTGGLIGLFMHEPASKLSQVIARHNQEGWKVVQVIPSSSGNILLIVRRILFLILTLLLYTTANGYYIVFERSDSISMSSGSSPLLPPTCTSCGKPVNPEDKFCQHCGNKQS